MPNGGVPMHMILHPQFCDDYVVYMRGENIGIFKKEEWESRFEKEAIVPVFTFTDEEMGAVLRFFLYWKYHDNMESFVTVLMEMEKREGG